MPSLQNQRHEKFALLTAQGHKRGPAYLEAGYQANRKEATKRGSLLFKRPEVGARVTELEDALREEGASAAGINREWVLQGLRQNISKASQGKPVMNSKGEPTGEYRYEAGAVNRGFELCGKELGMFADRHIFQNLDEELEGMSAEELREFVKGAASEVGLRVVDMTDGDTRTYILKHADRVGLVVHEKGSEGTCGAEATEAGDLPAVSETNGVSSTRRH